MPDRYRQEMLADWRGAAQTQGKDGHSVNGWYLKHQEEIILHPNTRKWVEFQLFGIHREKLY